MEEFELFRKFKDITQEEVEIVKIVQENMKILPQTTILDIGSSQGVVSRGLQKNKKNITLVDINEFKVDPLIKFIKSEWEKTKINGKFTIIIASHVWGHFGYTHTQRVALEKMLAHKDKDGEVILCYNVNSGFLGKLIKFSKKILGDFQYDYFDESLIDNFSKKEAIFKVKVKCGNFEELADLIRVLIITSEDNHNRVKKQFLDFLQENLEKPEFEIEQRVIFLS